MSRRTDAKSERIRRRLSPQWQALRRDIPTAIASAGTYLAVLCVVVAVLNLTTPPNPFPWGQPMFWLLALPLTGWALAVMDFGPRAVLVLRLLMATAGPASIAVLAVAFATGADGLPLYVAATAGAIVLSAVAAWFYRRSALRRQGPFR